jgi:fructokinase
MNLIWGIDLGGTKIEGALMDANRPGEAMVRERVPTESAQGYDHIIAQAVRLVERLEAVSGQKRPARIGIGTPGNVNPSNGLLYHSNTQCLNGRAFQRDLATALGVEIVIANDANCMALAEARLGAGRGYETMMGLILGTGVGGGLVVNGRILNGRHGIAGEWGQIVLDPQGPESAYGTQGTIESYLAGPGLERCYERLSGTRKPLKEIVRSAETHDDPAATQTIDQFVERFGQAVSILINIFDPHAIVVAGGVSNLDVIYSPRMRASLQKHVFQQDFETPLLRPQLGDSAGVFGAGMLVADCR